MKVISIAAVARDGTIGRANQLPWDIPEDMKFFRDSTRQNIMIMGRKNFDSIGKPLPQRLNAVVTRNREWQHPGVEVFHDVDESINFYLNHKDPEIAQKQLFIIGGADIYRLAMKKVDEVWLTEIDFDMKGDVFFPDYRDGLFHRPEFKKNLLREQLDFSTPFRYVFNRYVRI